MTKVLLVTCSILVALVAGESALRFWPTLFKDPSSASYFDTTRFLNIYSTYSKAELDTTLPLYSGNQSSNCTSRRPNTFNFHAYYGFNAVTIDRPCIQTLFQQTSNSMVYMGGSVMANYMAKNHLTTIDSYLAKKFPQMISLNVSEMGSRSTNEMIRFLIEIVDLRPASVIFLDGFNEFIALRHGGAPDDDYYWHNTYADRTNHPWHGILNWIIGNSKVLDLAFWRSGLLKAPGQSTESVSQEKIKAAAQLYLSNVQHIDQICRASSIRCMFFLQPSVFSKKKASSEEKNVVSASLSAFPEWAGILEAGYAEILKSPPVRLVDLRNVFDQTDQTAYFDDVHLSKLGNQIIADAIAKEISSRSH